SGRKIFSMSNPPATSLLIRDKRTKTCSELPTVARRVTTYDQGAKRTNWSSRSDIIVQWDQSLYAFRIVLRYAASPKLSLPKIREAEGGSTCCCLCDCGNAGGRGAGILRC